MPISDQQKTLLFAGTVLVVSLGASLYKLIHHVRPPENITTPTFLRQEFTPYFEMVQVHIAGAVSHPGVYEVTANQRIMDILPEAGKILENGNLDKINLAGIVKNGQRIYIPFQKIPKSKQAPEKSNEASGQPVSINNADLNALVAVSGIGPKTAAAIIAYRQAKGPFRRVEDLVNVKGIGPKTLERLRPAIRL